MGLFDYGVVGVHVFFWILCGKASMTSLPFVSGPKFDPPILLDGVMTLEMSIVTAKDLLQVSRNALVILFWGIFRHHEPGRITELQMRRISSPPSENSSWLEIKIEKYLEA